MSNETKNNTEIADLKPQEAQPLMVPSAKVMPRPVAAPPRPTAPYQITPKPSPTVNVGVEPINPDSANLRHLVEMDKQAWELMKPKLEAESKAYQKGDAYALFERLQPLGMPLMLVGDAGTGKSSAVLVRGYELNRPVIRFTCSGATVWEDFIGRFILRDKRTEFMYGPLVRAAELGAILLLDEANHLRAEEIGGIMGVAEGAPILVKENRGEVITPKPGFQIICTANGVGAEQAHLAAGSRQMNMALLDRFLAVIDFEYPSTEEEFKRLKAHGYSDLIAYAVSKTATLVRGAILSGQITGYWGTRSSIRMAKMMDLQLDVETVLSLMMRVFDSSQAETIREALLRVLEPLAKAEVGLLDVGDDKAKASDGSI